MEGIYTAVLFWSYPNQWYNLGCSTLKISGRSFCMHPNTRPCEKDKIFFQGGIFSCLDRELLLLGDAQLTAAQLTWCFRSGASLKTYIGCILQICKVWPLVDGCLCKWIQRHSGLEDKDSLRGRPAREIWVSLVSWHKGSGGRWLWLCKVLMTPSNTDMKMFWPSQATARHEFW